MDEDWGVIMRKLLTTIYNSLSTILTNITASNRNRKEDVDDFENPTDVDKIIPELKKGGK